MSTFFRILIFVGEFIILWIFTFIFLRINSSKKKKDNSQKKYNKSEVYNIIYISIINIILIGIFIFSYSSFVFLSYNKMIMMGVCILIFIILSFISFIDNSDNDETFKAFVLQMISIIFISVNLCLFSWLSIPFYEDRICIDEKESTEIVYPCVNLKAESTVGYTLDSEKKIYSYEFFYEDDNQIFEKELLVEDLKDEVTINQGHSYIKKDILTQTYLNKERKETDERYMVDIDTISYTLYKNPNNLVEIHRP